MVERLTHYDSDGRIYASRGWEIALSHLAAYEDTGLTPEEVAHAKDLLAAEQDGRLVTLPVGTKEGEK